MSKIEVFDVVTASHKTISVISQSSMRVYNCDRARINQPYAAIYNLRVYRRLETFAAIERFRHEREAMAIIYLLTRFFGV